MFVFLNFREKQIGQIVNTLPDNRCLGIVIVGPPCILYIILITKKKKKIHFVVSIPRGVYHVTFRERGGTFEPKEFDFRKRKKKKRKCFFFFFSHFFRGRAVGNNNNDNNVKLHNNK